MQDVIHPHHQHEHRVWVLPDTSLGRWTALVFTTALVVATAAPAAAWALQHLVAPGTGTPWFFALWGSSLVAIVVAAGAAVAALVALVHDHAVLLLIPVVAGLLAASALITTNGVLS